MDTIDRRIIAWLAEDGRASFAAIGHAVGLSAPAVKRRVDRLRQQGIIRGFTTVVDAEALGWGTEAVVEVHCRGNVSPQRLRSTLTAMPEVARAYTVSGAADAIVHLRAGSIRHLEQALEGLRGVEFIDRTVSTMVLSTLLERPSPVERTSEDGEGNGRIGSRN